MHPAGSRVPALTILSHPDYHRVGERAVLWDEAAEHGEALLSRWQLEFRHPGGGDARPLDDPYLSRRPIRLTAARFGGIRIDCTRTGTRVIANDDWISEDRVFLGVEVERGVVLVLAERLSLILHNLDARAVPDVPGFGLVGESPAMVRIRHEIQRLAAGERPVLLCGETGTGKTTVAHAIHQAGRGGRPCVTVCGSRETSIADLLARSSGGTLLLDALDGIEAEFQAELVRALDHGARDVRILATVSDRYSRSNDSSGTLFERLAADTLEIPALGKRRDDVGRLVFHFLRVELERLEAHERLVDPGPFSPPWLPVRLVASLAAYDWPRNVRQLRHVACQIAREHHGKRHVDLGSNLDELLEGKAESTITGWGSVVRQNRGAAGRSPEGISEIELLSALRAHRWQAEPTAAHLGVSPETLFALIEKFSDRGPRRKGPRRSPF